MAGLSLFSIFLLLEYSNTGCQLNSSAVALELVIGDQVTFSMIHPARYVFTLSMP